MKRILQVIPNETDPTSFYRGVGPITRLQKAYPELVFDSPPARMSWDTLMKYDIAFFQRPRVSQSVSAMQMCINMGLKIWVDYDDNYLEVPRDNPEYTTFEKSVSNIKEILRYADIVTVTTDHLKKVYYPFNSNVVVIPNAIDLKLMNDEPVPGIHKFVTWRGGTGHMGDLLEVKDEVIEAAKSNPDWTFHFLGFNPTFITDHIRHCHHPHADIITYLDRLQRLQPKIHVVPLTDHSFNRSRSCNAWTEATYAGAATIAPDFEEWQKPHITNYTKGKLFDALDHLMKNETEAEYLMRNSWEYIKENLSLESINKLRFQVIQDLCVG